MSTITDMPDLSGLPNVEGLQEQMIEQVDDALAQLEGPRQHVNALYEKYADLRQRLSGRSRSGGTRSSGTTAPRTPRGDRMEQFITAVNATPGKTISEYAKEMGIQKNYLYRIRDKAKNAGVIRIDGSHILPSNGADPAAPEATAEAETAGRGRKS